MNQLVDVSLFDHLNLSPVEDHVFDIYTDRQPQENENLGYINRSTNKLTIELANGHELNITQSITELNSNSETSSTGFICWKSSIHFVNWLQMDRCPFKLENSNLNIMELGSGVSGILASVLGPKCRSYIASDQKHILKLLKRNIQENTSDFISTTINDEVSKGKTSTSKLSTNDIVKTSRSKKSLSTNDTVKTTNSKPTKLLSTIDVIEFDWEYLQHGIHEYEQLKSNYSSNWGSKPDLIISCDTIYNEFLLPHLINAIDSLLTPSAAAIIIAQLRDCEMIEIFVNLVIKKNLNIHSIPNDLLSHQLNQGFVVYYITL